MTDYIALFRGINVGGRNLISMKELVCVMEDCGNKSVQTYIQSGNVIFSGKPETRERILDLIAERKGFRPDILILSVSEFEHAIKNNPFSSADGKACHFSFCKSRPESVDKDRLGELKAESEQFLLKDKVFYLHAPDGIGRSRLAANVERCLGVTITGRNLNTVERLSGLIGERAQGLQAQPDSDVGK